MKPKAKVNTPKFIKKEIPTHMKSGKFREIFSNMFFAEHIWASAYEKIIDLLVTSSSSFI